MKKTLTKLIIPLGFITVMLLSCKHQTVRVGYKAGTLTDQDCKVTIVKDSVIPMGTAKNLGQVRIQEAGGSLNCSEEDALLILKQEACAIGADLVVIFEEHYPGFLKPCYECRAKLYQSNRFMP